MDRNNEFEIAITTSKYIDALQAFELSQGK